jgi:hypothetical protein
LSEAKPGCLALQIIADFAVLNPATSLTLQRAMLARRPFLRDYGDSVKVSP